MNRASSTLPESRENDGERGIFIEPFPLRGVLRSQGVLDMFVCNCSEFLDRRTISFRAFRLVETGANEHQMGVVCHGV